METFTELKELAENPHYQAQKQKILFDLTDDMIDMPIIDLINGFNKLPHCFTLQSCYGHFIYNGQKDPHNLEALPVTDTITRVEYRIAYIAFCIKNSASEDYWPKLCKKSRRLTQKTYSFVAQNGSGKDRSILMHYKWNQTGSNIKIRL